MNQWEYQLLHVPLAPHSPKAVDDLRRRGRDGWEAVGAVPLSLPDPDMTCMVILLKRPKVK